MDKRKPTKNGRDSDSPYPPLPPLPFQILLYSDVLRYSLTLDDRCERGRTSWGDIYLHLTSPSMNRHKFRLRRSKETSGGTWRLMKPPIVPRKRGSEKPSRSYGLWGERTSHNEKYRNVHRYWVTRTYIDVGAEDFTVFPVCLPLIRVGIGKCWLCVLTKKS